MDDRHGNLESVPESVYGEAEKLRESLGQLNQQLASLVPSVFKEMEVVQVKNSRFQIMKIKGNRMELRVLPAQESGADKPPSA